MKRYLITVFFLTLTGLVVVYGRIEAEKTGYEIRRLGIQKRELLYQMKEAQFELAQKTSLGKIREKMQANRMELARPEKVLLARSRRVNRVSAGRGDSGAIRLAGLLWNTQTAHASSDR